MVRNWSFRALRAGVLAVFALATCAVGVSLWRDRSLAIDDGARDAHNIAVVLGGQIARSIQSIDIVLRGVQQRIHDFDAWNRSDATHLPDLRSIRVPLLQELANLPQALNIVVADDRGQVVVSTAARPTPDINVADRDYFRELATNDDDRMSISQPVANRVTGESTMVLARRIDGPGNTFLGIVFVSVKTNVLEGIYRAVDALDSQAFALMRRDGTVLIRYPDRPDIVGHKIPPQSRFHAVVRAGGGSYRSPGVFDTVMRWIAVTALKEYPLVVTIAVPEDVILREWRSRTAVVVAGTLTFLACAFVLLSIMARQYRSLSASEASLAAKSQALEYEHERLITNESELRTQNQRFDAALKNMGQGLAMFDGKARLVVCNEHYRTMLRLPLAATQPGCPLRDILAHCQEHLGFPADVDGFMAEFLPAMAANKSGAHEFEIADGRIFRATDGPMPDGGWVATFEDVTDGRRAEEKIKRLAHSDLLTGVANRSHFLEEIGKARSRLRTDEQPFSVLMLDLDRFKHVNDSLGHAAGDRLLKEVSRRLDASLRSSDVLARLGGDEFAVIQTPPRRFKPGEDATSIMRESAIVLANRLIDVIGEPCEIDGRKVVIGTSIGIAMAPNDATEPDELMKKADLALYRIKSEGRNGYSFFAREMADAADERHRMEADMREGLSRGEFELYYQPLIDLVAKRPCAMEALVRWNHPEQGLITPDRFISLAEDSGLVIPLGEWVLQSACAEAAKWPAHVKVAINVSPVQFRKSNLLDVIMCALVDSGLPPDRLEIEITERVLLEREADHLSTLHQLKHLGISIALDDFGTGYSSLSYLKMFPFDKIKIDRSFTRELLDRSDCAAIVCAIINLGRSLDVDTVAEGIETEQQLTVLRAAGLPQAQGFLFGRPVPAAQVRFDDDADGDTQAVAPPRVAAS